MKFRLTHLALAGTVAFATTPALAQLDTDTLGFKPFIGLSYGQTKGDTNVNFGAGSRFDDEDNGFQVSAGVKMDNGIILGLAYTDLGDYSVSIPMGTMIPNVGTALVDINSEVSYESYGAFIAYSFRPSDEIPISITPKIGFHRWESDGSVTANNITLVADDDGTDLFYGGALSYHVNDNLELMIGYDRYEADSDEADYLHVGTRFTF